jgi:hypothetical protein
MLEFLRDKPKGRKLRLFACACCRRVWHLLWVESGRPTIEASESFADGALTLTDLERWSDKHIPFGPVDKVSAFEAQIAASEHGYGEFAWRHAASVCASIARAKGAEESGVILGSCDWPKAMNAVEQSVQCFLLRDIFGNPFRPSPLLPHDILKWHDRTIPRLAEAIYQERQMPQGTLDNARLAILGDALLDAGSEDEALMRHLREPQVHVRGCWALDVILGKE